MFLKRFNTVVCLIAIVTTMSAYVHAGWEEVDDARRKGLPKTAIEALGPVIEDAMAHGRHAEAIKAICTRIAFEASIEGARAEERITRLEAELEKAPEPMRPMMQAILANWYWHYFQQNRWRFMQRTQTAEPPGDDFTTWDLPRILAEIDTHFTAALAKEEILKAIPIAQFDDLLEKGNTPDAYRPTLFDFLAHDALAFYQAGEQGAASPEDAFEIDATSPVFAPLAAFLAWDPKTTDTESPKLKALRLFQKLLAFHQDDTNPDAVLDADLWRLAFARNQAVGPELDEAYKAALRRFVERWPSHIITARALFAWASVLQTERNFTEAHELATRGAEQFPDSYGGVQCHNLIQQIEQKQVAIQTERVWNEPWPVINVDYKNIDKAFFRAVPYDFDKLLAMPRPRWGRHGDLITYLQYGTHNEKEREAFIQKILAMSPAAEWTASLPATTDYQERTEAVPVPGTLTPGFYLIIASHTPDFSAQHNQVTATSVWVSDLALIIRRNAKNGATDGFVLNARTGEPVPDATIRSWVRTENNRERMAKLETGPTTQTDHNGMFNLAYDEKQLLLLAEKDGHRVSATGEGRNVLSREHSLSTHTVLFTDRAIYRPGQEIQYKGICYRIDRAAQNIYETLLLQAVTIVLRDSNGREVARQQHRTNDYGAFSGSFTAPRGTVTGVMSLKAENGPRGYAHVSVEEYKRPKFQVQLEQPSIAGKLGEPLTVQGTAKAYTGASIGGAKVAWRVVRDVQFPPWCWWGYYCFPPHLGASQNIAHGSCTTDASGAFSIMFTALPDRSVPIQNEPTFSYTIHADITDSTGETRSGSITTRIGYTALSATLEAEPWQTPTSPVRWAVRTTSLDGEPQAAMGTIKIHALQQPDTVVRPPLSPAVRYDYWWYRANIGSNATPKSDPANPDTWELGNVVMELPFKTDGTGDAHIDAPLSAGIYRAILHTHDRFGKQVTARRTCQVVDPEEATYTVKLPHHVAAPTWSVEPGATFSAFWGTGYDSGRAFVEFERDGQLLQSFWTEPQRTQQMIAQEITEAMRGGLTMRITYVRENRAYLESRMIDVPWTNKQLDIRWEHFTSKLKPGATETWTAIVSGSDAKRAVAEMVATLYDASLDQYKPHTWQTLQHIFPREHTRLTSEFQNALTSFQLLQGHWDRNFKHAQSLSYRRYPSDIKQPHWHLFKKRGGVMMPMAMAVEAADAEGVVYANGALRQDKDATRGAMATGGSAPLTAAPAKPAKPDLSQVTARRNLNETAFFFPQLMSDENGIIRLTFTMPEALTEWRFMGFAHDQNLRNGLLTGTTVTAKELMVEPNPPRFVRENDTIAFTVKVSNQSAARQTGRVRLTFQNARTQKDVTEQLGISATDLPFDIPSKQSHTLSWSIHIPDGTEFLTYKAVGATDRLSDGEEGYLPVLSRRILVTESLPLPIRGAQTKRFAFDRLLNAGASNTLQHQRLTVQMVSQPIWYAVMALPYLMEYPYACSEQLFNRLYANTLARHIAGSDPKIRHIFDQWKDTPALDSPLEKSEDLKSVMLEETPWLREAQNERDARRHVGILFDTNRLDSETELTFDKLAQQQMNDGMWPWFPGCRGDAYITLYIVTGFGRLRHLGAPDVDVSLAIKALSALDETMERNYRRIQKQEHPETYVPSATDALYLYGRSFFLEDQPIAKPHREAIDFYLAQARTHWLRVGWRQSKAHLAIGLKRFGDTETARAIMASIKEYSVSDDELGMFWRDTELSWWWYRAPIETQALMIEAFDEVMADADAVEACKVWLLKQKQTRDWKTTKATADAVYALLLRGTNLLASDALVEVSLDGKTIEPRTVEAGTGFYEHAFVRGEIEPGMGRIEVTKRDEGVSWGSVHWQYLEEMGKVTPYEGTPLKLKKALYRKVSSTKGQVLEPVTGAVEVGDELVCRVELRVDRDMEYIHLKDQRGSGTEPVNVLSTAKYQDGLSYYESTRDTATHFFINYLPKGVYLFEYSVRTQLKGTYQSGVASIQCLYAPEFNSHSQSITISVE